MAKLKVIAALVVALSGIALEAEGLIDKVDVLAERVMEAMEKRLSPKEVSDLEEAYEFAVDYMLEELVGVDLSTAVYLSNAWGRMIREPDLCDKRSLEYVSTMAEFNPERWEKLASLTQAIKNYANKCLDTAYIADKLKPHHGFLLKGSYNHKEVEFINNEFIDDYWLENQKDTFPEFKNYTSIGGVSKSSMTIAKAILRAKENNIEDLKKEEKVHSYLKKRLYKPCIKYVNAFDGVMDILRPASSFLEGGFDKVISSLDNKSQEVVFRYRFCDNREIWDEQESKETSKKVVSDLESLTKSKS